MTASESPRAGLSRTLLILGLGAFLGIGGTLLLRRAAPGSGPAAAAKPPQYVCPMHPQVVQDHPGECSICGMNLERLGEGPAVPGEDPIVFYRNPMDPRVHSPVPMQDAMGMDYLPVRRSELDGGAPVEGLATVKIDADRQQMLGLRTVEAATGPVGGSWRTTGRVAVDETRVHKVNVKVEGFVERLFVDFTGKPVAKGQPLFTLYSPELLSAQNEFLLAVRTDQALAGSSVTGSSGPDLVASARQRLRLWDIPEAAIDALARGGQPLKSLTILSPASGVVTAKNVVQGARLLPGDAPFEITDLGQVWILADAYEGDLARLRVGARGTFTTPAVPDHGFPGTVAFIDPVLDPRTRTAKVRLVLANPNGLLKPELFGDVVFQGPAHEGLRIPVDAVVDAGTRKVVFVALGQGKFQPREVELGIQGGDLVEILKGLEAGEAVVTRANFLVDSESRLKAALASFGGRP